MKCIIISGYDDLQDQEIQHLDNQSVDLDDWDFLFFIPVESCFVQNYDIEVYIKSYYRPITIKKLLPEYKIQSLIEGNSDDVKWYENISFRGETWVVAVRHH
jgi:hypothetical protein